MFYTTLHIWGANFYQGLKIEKWHCVQFGIWVNLQQKVHWLCGNFVIELKRMAWKKQG
jgi:hypothetical protein